MASRDDILGVLEELRAALVKRQAIADQFRRPVVEPEPAPRDPLIELASVVRVMAGVMAAPKEVIRDANGLVVGVQSGAGGSGGAGPPLAGNGGADGGVRSLSAADDLPADLDGMLDAIRADLERMSVREVVRDPQTTRVVGVRTIQ